MVADRTSMARELDELMHQQIHTLKQDARISDAELISFRQRSQRIRVLCRNLNPGSGRPQAKEGNCAGRHARLSTSSVGRTADYWRGASSERVF
jgi:hypothetical protein